MKKIILLMAFLELCSTTSAYNSNSTVECYGNSSSHIIVYNITDLIVEEGAACSAEYFQQVVADNISLFPCPEEYNCSIWSSNSSGEYCYAAWPLEGFQILSTCETTTTTVTTTTTLTTSTATSTTEETTTVTATTISSTTVTVTTPGSGTLPNEWGIPTTYPGVGVGTLPGLNGGTMPSTGISNTTGLGTKILGVQTVDFLKYFALIIVLALLSFAAASLETGCLLTAIGLDFFVFVLPWLGILPLSLILIINVFGIAPFFLGGKK